MPFLWKDPTASINCQPELMPSNRCTGSCSSLVVLGGAQVTAASSATLQSSILRIVVRWSLVQKRGFPAQGSSEIEPGGIVSTTQ